MGLELGLGWEQRSWVLGTGVEGPGKGKEFTLDGPSLVLPSSNARKHSSAPVCEEKLFEPKHRTPPSSLTREVREGQQAGGGIPCP